MCIPLIMCEKNLLVQDVKELDTFLGLSSQNLMLHGILAMWHRSCTWHVCVAGTHPAVLLIDGHGLWAGGTRGQWLTLMVQHDDIHVQGRTVTAKGTQHSCNTNHHPHSQQPFCGLHLNFLLTKTEFIPFITTFIWPMYNGMLEGTGKPWAKNRCIICT